MSVGYPKVVFYLVLRDLSFLVPLVTCHPLRTANCQKRIPRHPHFLMLQTYFSILRSLHLRLSYHRLIKISYRRDNPLYRAPDENDLLFWGSNLLANKIVCLTISKIFLTVRISLPLIQLHFMNNMLKRRAFSISDFRYSFHNIVEKVRRFHF